MLSCANGKGFISARVKEEDINMIIYMMGNYCLGYRDKKKSVDKCVECDVILDDEKICDVCLGEEMKYLDNLQYIHSYGNRKTRSPKVESRTR